MKKVKLTKLEIETNGKNKVELTIEEAKELYEQLHDLFGKEVQFVPSSPIVIERYPREYWPNRNPIWYSDKTCCGVSGKNLSLTASFVSE